MSNQHQSMSMREREQRAEEERNKALRTETREQQQKRQASSVTSVNEPVQSSVGTAAHLPSINEPPGSNAVPIDPGEGEGGSTPPVLTSILPDSIVIGPELDFLLTATGEGFDAASIIVFDDEELVTTFVDATSLTAQAPMALAASTVDVEVHRGEEMSDVLTFEFTAVSRSTNRVPERKPKKSEPIHKRLQKKKGR